MVRKTITVNLAKNEMQRFFFSLGSQSWAKADHMQIHQDIQYQVMSHDIEFEITYSKALLLSYPYKC